MNIKREDSMSDEVVVDLAKARGDKLLDQAVSDWLGELKRARPLVDDFVRSAQASGLNSEALLRPMLSAVIQLSHWGDCLGPNGDLMARRQIIDLVTELIDDETGEEASVRYHKRHALIDQLMALGAGNQP
jgi:hypothetical protein